MSAGSRVMVFCDIIKLLCSMPWRVCDKPDSIPCNESSPVPVLDMSDCAGWNGVIDVLIEGAHDSRYDDAGETDDGKPPYVPDRREAQYETECPDEKTCTRIAWHVDVAIDAVRTSTGTCLFHVGESIEFMNHRYDREVVDRRRRRGRPFECPAVPRVACQVAIGRQ